MESLVSVHYLISGACHRGHSLKHTHIQNKHHWSSTGGGQRRTGEGLLLKKDLDANMKDREFKMHIFRTDVTETCLGGCSSSNHRREM